jgi:hypothetical protein
MGNLSLKEVAEKLSFECVLCGAELTVQEMADHADGHARRGECWSYRSFAGASQIDRALEGWPVAGPGGQELLWPFWQCTRRLAAAQRARALAV